MNDQFEEWLKEAQDSIAKEAIERQDPLFDAEPYRTADPNYSRQSAIGDMLSQFEFAFDGLKAVYQMAVEHGVPHQENHSFLSDHDIELYNALLHQYGLECWRNDQLG